MKTLSRLAVAALLGLVCFGAMLGLSRTDFMDRFEWRTYDLRFLTRNVRPLPVHPDVVLIGIDDKTREILPWTMGRVWHADVMRHVSGALPMAVGYDILFKERTQDVFGEAGGTSAIVEEAKAWDDKFLTGLLLFEPAPVLAYNFVLPEDTEEEAANVVRPTDEELARSLAFLKRFEITKVTGDLDALLVGQDPSLPDSQFAEASQLGFINAPWDPDGVRRRLPLVMTWPVEDPDKRLAVFPSLTLLMVCNYLQVEPAAIEVEIDEAIRLPTPKKTYVIPIDAQGRLLVNFAGPTTEAFRVAPFWQVLNWGRNGRTDLLDEFLGDKMVFVGEMGTGTVDTKPTPIGQDTPLVAMHLNAASSILRQDFVQKTAPAANVGILLVCCLVTAVVTAGIPARTSLLAAVVLLLGYGFIAWWAFVGSTLIVPMVAPMAGIILSFAVVIFYRYLTEERQKLWIRKALGRYLSPNIMTEVLAEPGRLRLGGERRRLTVLFSDIRNFTPFCESREPEEVVAILNEYLTHMTQQIFEHSGTLDKYVGDEIVAFFGAPGAHHADHALNAARAALAMKATLTKLQDKWRSEGREALDFGVGLNTGEMLVGNMGSSDIFDYTVIGDQVNLGARVETLTRKYGCSIIITESTYNEIRDRAEVRELGEETVKGKTRPIKVYELVALEEA